MRRNTDIGMLGTYENNLQYFFKPRPLRRKPLRQKLNMYRGTYDISMLGTCENNLTPHAKTMFIHNSYCDLNIKLFLHKYVQTLIQERLIS